MALDHFLPGEAKVMPRPSCGAALCAVAAVGSIGSGKGQSVGARVLIGSPAPTGDWIRIFSSGGMLIGGAFPARGGAAWSADAAIAAQPWRPA